MKRTSSFFLLGLALIVLAAGLAGYSYWQKGALDSELKSLDRSLANVNSKVLQYEENKITEAISAKSAVTSLKMTRVEWSSLINDIRKTIPKMNGGSPLVEVLSYAGSSNKQISLNVRTSSESTSSFLDVATLIKNFNESDNFKDTFVPSIGSSVDSEGNKVLSFVVNTSYVPSTDNLSDFPEEPAFEEPAIEEPAAEVKPVTVPR